MNNGLKSRLASREAILGLAILALLALVASRFAGFIRPANLANVLTDTSPLIILALGQMAVILTKCIDLSIAANLALCGMIAGLMDVAGVPLIVVLPVVIALGGCLGAVNGLLVWKLNIPSIVVTLGTMTIYRGSIFLMSEGKWINAHQMSASFKAFPRMVLLELPMMAWMMLACVVTFWLLLNRTALGRAFYAVGGNPHAAVYTGISVGRSQCAAFVLSGALAGLAGYLWVARYAVAYVDIAAGFELDVVAACVIGGVAIAGGAGSVAGAVMGAIFLGIIKNALPVVGISPFAQMAISGTAILIAIAFNSRRSANSGRIILKSAEAGRMEAAK